MRDLRACVALATLALAACDGCGAGQARSDAGVDAGSDAGFDAAFWTQPWYPTPPEVVRRIEDAACPAPAPIDAGDAPAPTLGDGGMPRVMWLVEPARDREIATGLGASGITRLSMKYTGFTEMPERSVGMLFNEGDTLFLTPEGRFRFAVMGGGAPLRRGAPITSAGGAWFLRRTHDAVFRNSLAFGDGGGPAGVADGYDHSLPPSGELNVSIPAVQHGGRVAFASGLDGILGLCVPSGQTEWTVRYDGSRLQSPHWSLWSADDDSLYFTPGGPGVYHFSPTGDLLQMIPTEGSPHSAFADRNAIALVPGCGLYVWAIQLCYRDACETGGWIERWGPDLDLLSRWDLPREFWSGGGVPARPWPMPTFVTPDCGFIVDLAGPGRRLSDPPVYARVKIDAAGVERWRVTPTNSFAPGFPTIDGGVLFLAYGLDLMGPDGDLRWHWDVPPEEGDLSAVVERTPLLARNGVLYYGLDRDVGLDWWVAAIATGVRPFTYGSNFTPTAGGGPFRDNSARTRP